MAQSREFFANIMKRALLIYSIKIKLQIAARSTGDAIATIDMVKNTNSRAIISILV